MQNTKSFLGQNLDVFKRDGRIRRGNGMVRGMIALLEADTGIWTMTCRAAS